ncbi:2-oxoglutarate and iron-dependent oxygenase domain-containing protein [Asticcacaulis sp. ZE23SCel15]|uniref:isopenicillin N synthase family dioxygenase n=1 Tax=Asticcacaulis sp. ZE23SCel15 TaxID=3059027 RepID=UPI00265D93C3|nr:2OG-Fe(II) oxygenase family protein [Asticcacaulis sp. ZE23SCel15]WKL58140.1 2-oxoglutarate and iron-dependent oxygenase domain-containing protein [Asticcacaulis sp. ZE23SCel15]
MTASAITPVPISLYAEDIDAFAQSLGASFERYGFAVLSGLFDKDGAGLDKTLVDQALDDTKAFFALPPETKMQYKVGVGGQRGYTPFGIETAKGASHHDLKEFWHTGRDLPDGHPYRDYMPENVWPGEISGFRDHVSELYTALDFLGKRVLKAIALYLKLDPEFFTPTVREGNSVLRLLHYPPVTVAGESVRAGAHGDINVITLLMGAEEPGLQLQDRDGTWLPITPPEGCIVINIGDMLSRLTNGVLPSTIHRVVNPAEGRKDFSRYSTPFFLHFEPPYVIETLTNCITEDRPNQFPDPITAEDFLQQRLREIKLT